MTDDDIRNYRLFGPFTILQVMLTLAVLGIVLTIVAQRFF